MCDGFSSYFCQQYYTELSVSLFSHFKSYLAIPFHNLGHRNAHPHGGSSSSSIINVNFTFGCRIKLAMND